MSGYEDLTRRLVTALEEAVTADVNGASENEVLKAEPSLPPPNLRTHL